MTFPHSIAEKGLSLGGSDGGVSSCFSFLSTPLTCSLSKGSGTGFVGLLGVPPPPTPHSVDTRVSPFFRVNHGSLLQVSLVFQTPSWGQMDLVAGRELMEGKLGAQ